MASLKDIRGRIQSFKNMRKITRAMEMVAAARLRRAEQRIEHLRPYADALRRMTSRAAQAAENIPNLPILEEKEQVERVGILLVTGDRGLAGPFNAQIIRAGNRRAAELRAEGQQALWYASGRRGVSSLTFRGLELGGSWTGFTDRPAFADARAIAEAIDDFGPDFDAEGNPIEEGESDRITAEETRGDGGRAEEPREAAEGDEQVQEAPEQEAARA